MDTTKVYLDTCLLIGSIKWLLEKGHHKNNSDSFFKIFKRGEQQPDEMTLFSNHEEIESYISIISLAEIVKVLVHDDRFKKYHLNQKQIKGLIDSLQNIFHFNIMLTFKFDGKSIDGNMFTRNILDYVYTHGHIPDCIHVDIARINELLFITEETKMCKLNCHYKNITTFNHYSKQFEN